MKRFNYKDVAKEQGWNFKAIKPKVENKSGYDYYKEVLLCIFPNTKMLDIGCGSGEKSIKYFSGAKKIVMIDNEPEMLKRVRANITQMIPEKGRKKFEVKIGDKEKLDFADNSFDVVVSRHCGAKVSEIYRVLKKGGIFISEDIDETDCLELKEMFGRGQGYDRLKAINLEKQEIVDDCVLSKFSEISLKTFGYDEYYKSKFELLYLLTRTPILEYYDEKNDDKILDEYIKKFMSKKGILLKRRLYAIKLKK